MAEKIVTDFAGLRSAIQDSTTTDITLANDIVFSSGGIQIPRTKGNLTIDGGGHTVTDYNSLAYTDTIYFPNTAGSAVTVTLRNVVWSGRNYYGVICAYDGSNTSNVTVVLDSVRYTGPEFVYNRYGITHIRDCTVSLERNGSAANPEELCEGNRIYIEGNVSVLSGATSSAVIWFPYAGSSLTVAENASFTLEAPSTYLIYADTAAQPTLTFQKNSSTDISVKNGLFYASGPSAHIASSFTLRSGAFFRAVTSASNGVPVLKCAGAFSAEEGSAFHLISPTAGTSPLMYFSNQASITFQAPKSVLLYDNGAKIFSFRSGSTAAPNTIKLEAEQVNLWTTAKKPYESAGGFDDAPAAAFHRRGHAANLTAAVQMTTSATLSVTSDLTAEDTGYPMDASTFNPLSAAVLSMGELALNLDAVTDISPAITGNSDASAEIRAELPGVALSGTADASGAFALPLTVPPPVDAQVVVSANHLFLTKSRTETTEGSVSVTRLVELEFLTFAVPYHRSTVKRRDPDWYLEVTDTRKSGGDWYLYASLSGPLQADNGALEHALTFRKDGDETALSTTPILIRQGHWAPPPVVTRVSWAEAEGLLLSVLPEEQYASGRYTAEIEWQISTEEP